MNSSVHWRTPSLTVSDCRGLPIRQVAYLRTVAGATADALITHQHHDVVGRLTEQWDPRLSGNAPKPNLSTIYRLSGEPVSVDSVDAGWRLSLAGVAGEVLQRWDARDSHWRTTFDNQLRVIALEENARPDVERFTYADASADAGHNLRRQLIEQRDPSGSLRFDSYSLDGQALRENRTFADDRAYRSTRLVSALGVVLKQSDAGQHEQRFRYDIAGQLKQVQLLIDAGGDVQDILSDAQYNAAGQIIAQHAGNGVLSTWTYDPADGRLSQLKAQKNQEKPLQDFAYVYDPMGNVTRIEDLGFTPAYFRNQRIDGHRDFRYDSQYQLRSATGYDDAPPSDLPGRPQPGDPNNRHNYTQRYDYDAGGNLITLSHERDGASYTQRMFISPTSNRGARWKDGDPQPILDELFDRHGNLLALQRGQPMSWNARDQLSQVVLLEHSNDLPDDEETYLYSQGVRVGKSHKSHTPSTTHFQNVLYLPGLEIRTRDNGEELHVITVSGGRGQVRCLHWVAGQPEGIEANQLRYNLDDHLGSCAMELDQQARVISHEGYYPFGGTAWLTAGSRLEVSYKTIRYSGKEMDDSGLYYYGARYYAAGLQRWVSADPGGDVDGLNLYGFVGNNPLRYVDPEGGVKAENAITFYAEFISVLGELSTKTLGQVHDVVNKKHIKRNLLMNFVSVVPAGVIGYEAGNVFGAQAGQLIPDVPHATSVGGTDRLPYVEAVTGGNFGGDIAGSITDTVTQLGGQLTTFAQNMGRTGPLIPQTSTMSVAAIDRALGVPEVANEIQLNWSSIKDEVIDPTLNAILNPDFIINRGMGAWISILPGAFTMFQRAVEAEDIKNGLDPAKIAKIDGMLADWKTATLQRSAWMENAFDALGTNVVQLGQGPNGARAPITRAGLQQATTATLHNIHQLQGAMAAYKEAGTTDNQFLAQQRNTAAKKASLR
ncbi:RHS repeat domain-containing protein [Pseudomonas frederiksbergensis]|uniref:RHS repeat domain-containing protein n=1 Tax=Pseudomonas frederiksbergensis TaxID=104087 RepID=UPI003D1D9040